MKLKKVPANLFCKVRSLKTVVMLEVEEITDGNLVDGAPFSDTCINNCFFPKLRKIGAYAFNNGHIKSLDIDNFPVLKKVGDAAFLGCPIENLDLPFLETIGKCSF